MTLIRTNKTQINIEMLTTHWFLVYVLFLFTLYYLATAELP